MNKRGWKLAVASFKRFARIYSGFGRGMHETSYVNGYARGYEQAAKEARQIARGRRA